MMDELCEWLGEHPRADPVGLLPRDRPHRIRSPTSWNSRDEVEIRSILDADASMFLVTRQPRDRLLPFGLLGRKGKVSPVIRDHAVGAVARKGLALLGGRSLAARSRDEMAGIWRPCRSPRASRTQERRQALEQTSPAANAARKASQGVSPSPPGARSRGGSRPPPCARSTHAGLARPRANFVGVARNRLVEGLGEARPRARDSRWTNPISVLSRAERGSKLKEPRRGARGRRAKVLACRLAAAERGLALRARLRQRSRA
jgi:hypothetical protein